MLLKSVYYCVRAGVQWWGGGCPAFMSGGREERGPMQLLPFKLVSWNACHSVTTCCYDDTSFLLWCSCEALASWISVCCLADEENKSCHQNSVRWGELMCTCDMYVHLIMSSCVHLYTQDTSKISLIPRPPPWGWGCGEEGGGWEWDYSIILLVAWHHMVTRWGSVRVIRIMADRVQR